MKPGVQPDETLTCENCGRHGAIQFDDRALCEECYENMGSCCPEFGGFDLWQEPADEKKKAGERILPAEHTE